MVGGDHEVAAQHDAEATGDGGAVHRGDDRLRVDALDEDRRPGAVVGGDAIARGEGLEVHPRAEGLVAGAGEHDHAHRVVVLRARERLADAAVRRRGPARSAARGRLMVTSLTNPVVTTSTVMGG